MDSEEKSMSGVICDWSKQLTSLWVLYPFTFVVEQYLELLRFIVHSNFIFLYFCFTKWKNFTADAKLYSVTL